MPVFAKIINQKRILKHVAHSVLGLSSKSEHVKTQFETMSSPSEPSS